MLRKLLVLGAASGALCLLPAMASAQPQAGDWELTLDGHGGSDKDLKNNGMDVGASLGYFFTKNAEVSIRQGVSWDDWSGGADWYLTTAAAFDWHFDLDQWQPYLGASIGIGYGSGKPQYGLGLEGGVKYYVHRNAFLFGQIAYTIDLRDSDNSWFNYTLGIGTNW